MMLQYRKLMRAMATVVAIGFLLAPALVAADAPADDEAAIAALEVAAADDAAPECAVAETALAPVDGIGWVAMSCSSECTAQYLVCMDDCDAWPYPGCEQDCRNALNACRFSCF